MIPSKPASVIYSDETQSSGYKRIKDSFDQFIKSKDTQQGPSVDNVPSDQSRVTNTSSIPTKEKLCEPEIKADIHRRNVAFALQYPYECGVYAPECNDGRSRIKSELDDEVILTELT